MADTANSASPGLIVFLPLVAAFVGAIIGAWANSWYRNREAKKAEDRERDGLLLLIHAELHHNVSLLMALVDNPDEPTLKTYSNFNPKYGPVLGFV